MASTLLRDTDSVSMARSLEVRVPLLDTPLGGVRAGALPDAARQRYPTQKRCWWKLWLDCCLKKFLGSEKKHLRCRWEEWLPRTAAPAAGKSSFADIAPSACASSFARKGVPVQRSRTAFLEGQTSWSRPWALYVLNEWCKRHLGRR